MSRKVKKQTRRGNQEGSIYQRKDGKWCGQVLTGYNELGKPVRKTFYAETRLEVSKKVNDAVHAVLSGVGEVLAKTTTVEHLMTDYLWLYKKPTIADVTFDWLLCLNNTHILPALGESLVHEISANQLQILINRLHNEKKLSLHLIKSVRDLLNQAFTYGVDTGIVSSNPVSKTRLPKASREKSEEKENARVITKQDRIKILEATKKNLCMKTALIVLMFTGMRIGEFLALPWQNVDFENRTITIDRAITHRCEYDSDGKLLCRTTVVGDTKTQCSNRKIKVSPIVVDVLREWKAYLPRHMKVKVTHDLTAPETVVFPNAFGEMRTYDGFRTTYRRFMSDNNLGDYTLHSYRHTFATMLLEANVNPRVVQKLLGHRDIETTLGIYSHVLPEVYDGVADTLTSIHTGMSEQNTTCVL